MVGIRSLPFGIAYFQVRTVSFREGNNDDNHISPGLVQKNSGVQSSEFVKFSETAKLGTSSRGATAT